MGDLKREREAKRLCGYATSLHKIFSRLFPNTSKEEVGGRFKAFSKMASLKNVKLLDRKVIEEISELSGIVSRSGRKKFFDSLVKLGLFTKTNHVLKLTEKGELIWESFINFIDKYENRSQKGITKIKFPYYESLLTIVETNGEDFCQFFHNFCICNPTKNPVSYKVLEIFSQTPFFGNFQLTDFSSEIKEYKIIHQTPTQKTIRLEFKKPIKNGESIEVWFKYEWPEFFLNTWKKWEFPIYTKGYPIKYFIGIFRIVGEYKIIKDSFTLNTTKPKKESISIGKFKAFQPVINEIGDYKEIIWKMENLPTHMNFVFSWEHD